MQRKYDQFGVRTNNCTDMVVETAALAGINLSPPHSPHLCRRKRRFWVGRGVFGRIPNTAYWSSARPKFWNWICAILPG